ncbi:MAG TPA: ArsA family ATPase [Actinomycetales bacterium]|nr:ArsA family ATPase [Actinomycetales bacterium]
MPAAEDGPLITLVGGKGGVGKTTVAAAHARLLSRRGERVLLVSTDPAHSTGDLLGVDPGDEPTPVADRWWVVELDAEQAARDHVDRIAAEAADVVPKEVLPAVRRHLKAAVASPGTVESALLDRLGDVLVGAAASYDRVVVDTAPTGHTLRLLVLPDLLSGWVEGLLRRRQDVLRNDRMVHSMAGDDPGPEADPVADRLRARRDRLDELRRLLVEQAVINLVLVPERLPVVETVRARDALTDGGLRVGAVVVNRVFPDGDHPFLAARAVQQAHWLTEIDDVLGTHPRVLLPHLARDPGRGDLDALADLLADGGL